MCRKLFQNEWMELVNRITCGICFSFPGKRSLMNTSRACFSEEGTPATIRKIVPTMLVNKMLTALFDSLGLSSQSSRNMSVYTNRSNQLCKVLLQGSPSYHMLNVLRFILF